MRMFMLVCSSVVLIGSGYEAAAAFGAPGVPVKLQAGAAAVDVTPVEFPVIVNGMVEERTASAAHDRLMARALVLDDGSVRLAIVIVDSLMLPRDLLDEVKQEAQMLTEIPADRILIAATHTHSAPSAMPCLGSREDPGYRQYLPDQIVRSIILANQQLQPARLGWAVIKDDVHNHCRRWVFRADRLMEDPFGNRSVRAHMHPGHQSPNHIGPSGPADTDLTILSVQTADGKPLAVLGNYAMHYYGSPLVSGDFCGRFGEAFAELAGFKGESPTFVGMMSQGTSGDSMWPNYALPAGTPDLDAYTRGVAEYAVKAWQQIEYRTDVSLAMAEELVSFRRRVPDAARMDWARSLIAQVGDRLPRGWSEVYAFEQVHLHERPEVELRLQAIRIGDLGITAIPDEVFGITGLKLKARSPLVHTMNIELANGAEGYIPPPEQHDLGGYTTWPARTAGLEVHAEPVIVETLLRLLEQVSGTSQKLLVDEPHSYSRAVLESKPVAYWRLGEIDGYVAHDVAGSRHAVYEPGCARYLDGPAGAGLEQLPRGNRAAHFAGGRVRADLPELGHQYSFECWVWNGLPNDASAVTGYFFSRGPDGVEGAPGDHLGIGGTYENSHAQGRLIVFNGNDRNELLVGRTELLPKSWYHVAFVRDGRRVQVFLNGSAEPEIEGELSEPTAPSASVFLGGRTDGLYGLQGKLDECAVYDRPLSPSEIATHFQTAELPVAQPDPAPLSPAESLARIHVRSGFEVQLVAAEPEVIDPVAIDWGFDGKLWVAEMADYPSGMDGQGKPGGRIRFLEDRNGDGRYETSTLFLEGVNFPNGILAWDKGVLVTAAPEIFYAEDTDGDGRADVRRTLYSGFMEGNQQLRVNGLRYGLDNWIYCASGSHHGGYGADSAIRSEITGERIQVGSRDFRIRPDLGLLDPQSGPSQFGRNRDAWGNWFGVQNSYPLWHYVLEDHNIRRNPFHAPPDPRHQVVTPANPRVYSAAKPEKRFHSFEQSGRFTSACSGMIYQDQLLFPLDPADSGWTVQHAFTCEPFSNLVQHNVVYAEGVSFRAERDPVEARADREPAEPELDFFASEDRWCRPVMVRTGPDGGLWVVDMYRYMIEHPHWLPKEGQDELRPFFRSGDDRGRIYRVVPTGFQAQPPIRMSEATTTELIRYLEHSNGWIREAAQRLLLSKQELRTADRASDAIVLLTNIVRTSSSPLARLHGLYVLDGLQQLSPELLNDCMHDTHPGVRRAAVRLMAVQQLPSGSIAELVRDPDAKVRLEVACALGIKTDAEAGVALADLLRESDPYLQSAVLSSLTSANISNVLAQVFGFPETDSTGDAWSGEVRRQLCVQAVYLAGDADLGNLLSQISRRYLQTGDADHAGLLAELLDRIDQRERTMIYSESKDLSGLIRDVFVKARGLVTSDELEESMRATSMILLGRQAEQRQTDLELLTSLVRPQSPLQLQQRAMDRLLQMGEAGSLQQIIRAWKSLSPAVRTKILDEASQHRSLAAAVLEGLSADVILSSEINAIQRQQMLSVKDETLRRGFEQRLSSTGTMNRKAVIETYRESLTLKGDLAAGQKLFRTKCATCHRFQDFGHEVGPNLASLTNKTPEALLSAMMDPNAAVEAKYVSYVVVTTPGRTVSGILSTETASSLTLMAAEAKSESVLRNEIEELSSTGKSLMPEGLEKELTPQNVADIISYISQ